MQVQAPDPDLNLGSHPSSCRPGPPPAGPATPPPVGTTPAPSKGLAEFTFKLRQPGGAEWEGVDSSLDVRLRWVSKFRWLGQRRCR